MCYCYYFYGYFVARVVYGMRYPKDMGWGKIRCGSSDAARDGSSNGVRYGSSKGLRYGSSHGERGGSSNRVIRYGSSNGVVRYGSSNERRSTVCSSDGVRYGSSNEFGTVPLMSTVRFL